MLANINTAEHRIIEGRSYWKLNMTMMVDTKDMQELTQRLEKNVGGVKLTWQ